MISAEVARSCTIFFPTQQVSSSRSTERLLFRISFRHGLVEYITHHRLLPSKAAIELRTEGHFFKILWMFGLYQYDYITHLYHDCTTTVYRRTGAAEELGFTSERVQHMIGSWVLHVIFST
jgi:hypothetical protein